MSASDRFDSKVMTDSSGCHMWVAGKTAAGYGNFKFNGKDVNAHRFSFERAKGKIPDEAHIDHLCRNRSCVNPLHLEAVSQRENIMRGVGYTANAARKTACKRGHEFTAENTYIWKTSRICRRCRRAARG